MREKGSGAETGAVHRGCSPSGAGIELGQRALRTPNRTLLPRESTVVDGFVSFDRPNGRRQHPAEWATSGPFPSQQTIFHNE